MNEDSYNLIELATVDSTSNYLSRLAAEGAPHGTAVAAREQTAGRGQRGNSWEAEPGKNITMSILLRAPYLPPIHPTRQFALSEHVALAVAEVVNELLPKTEEITVKWPNDIYVGNRKIAGILLECAINSRGIEQMIVGVGLNVNQTHFMSDAPNPVSLAGLTGKDYDLEEIRQKLIEAISRLPESTNEDYPFPVTHRRYMATLWRREGTHSYRDKETGEEFRAEITNVEPDGRLALRLEDGSERLYPFRTLTAIL